MSSYVVRNERNNTWATLLAKAGKLLKLLKATKFLKPLITLASLMVSTTVYAFSLPGGWIFAVGFVIMILVHETGHVAALRRKGIRASAPVFIPFLGAAIFAPKLGDRNQEAYVGYAGPLIGGAGALLLLAFVALMAHPPVMLELIAYVALTINAFNLIPLSPLDGGRITQAIGPRFRWAGAAMLVALTVATGNPGMMLIWLIALGSFPMDRRLRAALAVLFWTTMAGMELLGIGAKEGLAWILFDMIIGFGFVVAFALSARKQAKELATTTDDRPQLDVRRKVFWLGAYFFLAVVLLGLTVVSHGFLPKGAS